MTVTPNPEYRKQRATTQTANPIVTNDADSGYRIGDIIHATANDTVWRCHDATVGAAVWRRFAELDADAEFVGPIFPKRLLDTDNSTVPPLGELSAVVDNLDSPTEVSGVSIGDGETAGGVKLSVGSDSRVVHNTRPTSSVIFSPAIDTEGPGPIQYPLADVAVKAGVWYEIQYFITMEDVDGLGDIQARFYTDSATLGSLATLRAYPVDYTSSFKSVATLVNSTGGPLLIPQSMPPNSSAVTLLVIINALFLEDTTVKVNFSRPSGGSGIMYAEVSEAIIIKESPAINIDDA